MNESATPFTKRPTLRVVVLHEDAAADERAVTLLRIIERMFLDIADVCVKRWSFHQLERLDVRAMASHHGRDATILMVCGSSGQNIPHTVASWMERTFQSAHSRKPLIIRFEEGSVLEEDIARKLASTWKVPFACDFSLDATSCWASLREFVEDRLHSLQDSEEDDSDSEPFSRIPVHLQGPTESAPMDQAIRDHAYHLWVNAGRPDGRNLEFWHQAERELRSFQTSLKSPESTQDFHPKTKHHENNTHPTDTRRLPASEFLLRIPSDIHAGTRNALLQHLARLPKELLSRCINDLQPSASTFQPNHTHRHTQPAREPSAPSSQFHQPSIHPMIIRLDWFGCEPTSLREQRIHRTLETLQAIKPISRASVRVEEQSKNSPAFHLTLMLTMPGPDVLAHGSGHTFDEALHKLEASAVKTLEGRAQKARQLNGAVRGVKALHRG